MHRRDLMRLTAAVTLALPLWALPVLAGTLSYSPGLIETKLAEGRVVFVDYRASWCTTCAAQARVIAALRAENPAYDAKIIFIEVDWDTWQDDSVTTSRNVPRRSTLLLLKGDRELARNVADTSQASIKAMLDAGLQAAAGA